MFAKYYNNILLITRITLFQINQLLSAVHFIQPIILCLKKRSYQTLFLILFRLVADRQCSSNRVYLRISTLRSTRNGKGEFLARQRACNLGFSPFILLQYGYQSRACIYLRNLPCSFSASERTFTGRQYGNQHCSTEESIPPLTSV